MDSVAWLAAEPELLNVALELIESWDEAESQTLDSSDASTAQSDSGGEGDDQDTARDDVGNRGGSQRAPMNSKALPSSVTKREITRRVKPSTVASTHHRRRKEIFHLRNELEKLERQLGQLQLEKKKRRLEELSADQPIAIMWRQIAAQQLRLREDAEMNQANLRKLVDKQSQVARGLMKMIEKARRIESDAAFEAVKRPRSGPRFQFPLLQEQDLLMRIDLVRSSLDELFTFSKFHDGSDKFVDLTVSVHEADEVVIEVRDVWTVSFEHDRVLDALWQYILTEENTIWRPPQSHQNDRLDDGGRVLSSHFRVYNRVGDLSCDYTGQFVAKRFTTCPPAIISIMLSQPSASAGTQNSGVYGQATSCFRVVSAPSQPGASRIESSLRFSLRIDPDIDSKWRYHAGFLTNTILGRLSKDIEKEHDIVMKLLQLSLAP